MCIYLLRGKWKKKPTPPGNRAGSGLRAVCTERGQPAAGPDAGSRAGAVQTRSHPQGKVPPVGPPQQPPAPSPEAPPADFFPSSKYTNKIRDKISPSPAPAKHSRWLWLQFTKLVAYLVNRSVTCWYHVKPSLLKFYLSLSACSLTELQVTSLSLIFGTGRVRFTYERPVSRSPSSSLGGGRLF